YTCYPTIRLTPNRKVLKDQRLTSLDQCFNAHDNSRLDSEGKERSIVHNPDMMNKQRRPRLMLRRKDLLQFPPSGIRLEDKSLYRTSFRGDICARVEPFRPSDEGINGLETAFQRDGRIEQQAVSGDKAKTVYCGWPNYPPKSVYRNDYDCEGCCMLGDVPNFQKGSQSSDTLNLRRQSTDYRDNFHTWVTAPSSLSHLLLRDGYDWKPKPAVYLPEDPAKHKPMETNTAYKTAFIDYTCGMRSSARPSALLSAVRSEISERKLLNGCKGVSETTPRSLYRDSFVGQREVDRWADRRVRQNVSSFVQNTGVPHQDDVNYWSRMPTECYRDYKTAMFLEAHKISGEGSNVEC
ncbi:hypothetical protein P879_10172, partial [Paragonimus westermani]